jgi:hypothetical protein
MGNQGVDVQLSESALRLFPFGVECKNRARIAIYGDFQQAMENSKGTVPLLIIKQNHSKPLAVLDLDHFMELVKGTHGNHEDN